ncbi:DNA polymerase III subunit gamma/tau, partial [bacterium]|nr:DNA polymerase III subunit gamma/tau [bacterium]
MAQPENTHLNLARKWRPQTFDTVIGQDIPVRMLKNSLYLQKFFPVYLFAGQRGCGKTTTARIF